MSAHKIMLIEKIHRTIQAMRNAKASGNTEWVERYGDALDAMESDLPRGSGIDRGTRLDLERCRDNRVVFDVSFHHMDDNGYYDGWTDHKIVVTPEFGGFDIRITGRDRNGIKDYLRDVYAHALGEEVTSY